MKKICVVTGTRAEYGLLYPLMKRIKEDDELHLQLIATGMHLSPEFGLTYKIIEKDGFLIDKKIESLLSSDTAVGISKSMGLSMISFAEAYAELQPDMVLILGDRFEIFAAVSAAMTARIPIAHCHGGETTQGAIDEAIRHSVTKMSHLHFCSTQAYKKRIIQLGENPDFVFNVGALGIENINKLKLLNRQEFEQSISFKLDAKYKFLITYHPVTLESNTSENQIDNLIAALDNIENAKLIFTKANADTDGRIINAKIDEYVKKNPQKAICFNSLGQLRYLSALQYVDAVIGNSSSGLIEVPSFKKPTVNIGDRQLGRIQAKSVIQTSPQTVDIEKAIRLAVSKEFKAGLKNMDNPYGKGNASEVILQKLKTVDFNNLLKKKFYDEFI
ncbi:MAG: UDP-N-acetylglucosamine 2-epimerase (hydrolyzing) [Candidatus Delongbacteria bacterium]|nr:MAG: UDP-N-acetylglucosamine 2-epimerase (hydrolyzing) [Candidatus Delongbacteria bacterium]